MIYGPVPQKRLPKQNPERIFLLTERWDRAAQAMEQWATRARQCFDFFEGRQWTEEQIAALRNEGRPAMTFNKIAPLVRLVVGYQRSNRTDVTYLPANDGMGTEQLAELHSNIFKSIADTGGLKWEDAQMFLDGIIGGRGYQDWRLDFEENDFGEIRPETLDPFTVYVDPDGQRYDINTGSYVMTSRWLSIEEMEFQWGKRAAQLIKPFLDGMSWTSLPASIMGEHEEITPIRSFGEDEQWNDTHGSFRDLFHTELIDPQRKSIRVLDCQYYVKEWADVFVDLETGDRAPVPRHWAPEKIQRALYAAEQIGNPMTIVRRPLRRVRWTILAGDIMVYDGWSPYDSFTIVPYFPYFRRGVTDGMVKDLIDPQMEINKRRSSEIEIVARSSNSGWEYHEDALAAEQEQNLLDYGSAPGFNLKWKGQIKPERINPNPPPMAMERLEQKARDDLREISGINESALGEIDKVQSGKAIEAKQRQAVVALQMYIDNWSRTKELQGRKSLNLVQRHYTENRMFRIVGESGKLVQTMVNKRQIDPMTGKVLIENDVTVGKYTTVVDESPMSATFKNAQFEEALMLLEKTGLPAELLLDILIDLSSMPRKDEIKERLAQMGLGGTAISTGTVPVPGVAPTMAPAIDQSVTPGGAVLPMAAE